MGLTLPLELSRISGATWSTSVKLMISAHVESILLRNFYNRKFICPVNYNEVITTRKRNNESSHTFKGGLNLEPKIGLHDGYIVMMDFKSLYPSIIAEHDICFTTVEYKENHEAIPPVIKEKYRNKGILSRIVWSLVNKRDKVRKNMQKCTDDFERRKLELRQIGLKKMANSMYGFLGYQRSRFYNPALAALIARLGRDILRALVAKLIEKGLQVVYGDTDSAGVLFEKENAEIVKTLVTDFCRDYRYISIDMSIVYKTMLIVKKKKYVAWSIDEKQKRDIKGLEMVRRDWCPLVYKVCEGFLNIVETGIRGNILREEILKYISKVAENIRQLKNISDFIISQEIHIDNVRLAKENSKGRPYIDIAKKEILEGRQLPPGRCISYIMTRNDNTSTTEAVYVCFKNKKMSYKIDIDYYLRKQIYPSLSRLVTVIEKLTDTDVALSLGLNISNQPRRSIPQPEIKISGFFIRCCCGDITSVKDIFSTDKILTCLHCQKVYDIDDILEQLKTYINNILNVDNLSKIICTTYGCKYEINVNNSVDEALRILRGNCPICRKKESLTWAEISDDPCQILTNIRVLFDIDLYVLKEQGFTSEQVLKYEKIIQYIYNCEKSLCRNYVTFF